MKIKKILTAICTMAVALTTFTFPSPVTAADTAMRDITTQEIVNDMGLGINLGNTFESYADWIKQQTVQAYETAWGSPVITQNIINGYANEGFGVLRIPVAWSNLMSADYTISTDYINRVKTIVDWTLEAGMYAIINLHWDGGWINKFPENETEYMKKYTAIWTQVSDAFKDYNDYLMFESQNEELGWSSLSSSESYALVNKINQKFVDIIRASGGNNPKRHLLISGYNTDISKTCHSYFKMPNDPAGRCALSVHYYTPATFCILEEDADWGKCRETWGTSSDFTELNNLMDLMVKTYVSKGVPVIIGEYGCPKKNKDAESVQLYIKSVAEAAYSRDMCPVLWDISIYEDSSKGLHYSRSSYKLIDQTLKEQLQEILVKYTKDNDDTIPDDNNNETKKGDVNSDNNINLYDAIEIAKYIMKMRTFTNEEFLLADYNSDNNVNLYDAIGIAKLIMQNT